MIHRFFLKGLKFIIGTTILFFLVYKIGFGRVVYALSSANLFLLPLVIIGIILITLLYPLSLVMLYIPLKTRGVSLGEFFKLRLLTQIIGNITPNKIGELYLIFFLKRRYKINVAPIFYIFTFDKVTSVAHAFVFAAIGFLLLFRDIQKSTWLALVAFGVIISMVILYYGLKKMHKLSWKILRIQNLQLFFSGFAEFFQSYTKKQRPYIAYNIIFTFIASVATAAVGYITFLALDVYISFITVFFITSMIAVAAIVPLNVFGIGIKEVSAIYFYSLVGIDPSVTTAVVIIVTLAKYAVYGFLYPFVS